MGKQSQTRKSEISQIATLVSEVSYVREKKKAEKNAEKSSGAWLYVAFT